MSARESERAAEFQQAQAQIDAKAEGDAAREREIRRKRNLLRAISSQRASAGARGVEFGEGSPGALARLDTEQANTDLQIDRANVSQRQRGLRAQGRAAQARGEAQAAATLLDTASRTGRTLAPGIGSQ